MILDHTKKYFKIGGHLIEMSFADEPNTELFASISLHMQAICQRLLLLWTTLNLDL